MAYIYTIEYCSAITKHEIMSSTTKWTQMEASIPSDKLVPKRQMSCFSDV